MSKKSKSRLRGTNRGAVVSPELLAEMTHFPAIAAATPSASLTIEDVRQRYAPPRTLGCKEEVRLALDSALADTGVYSLLQHTLQMGMGVFPQFMGYGALQNIAQNGLVRACISTVADDMTREWITLQREGDAVQGADNNLLAELTGLMSRMRVKEHFAEAVELAGYEGGAFLFIDTGATGDALRDPLDISPNSGELGQEKDLRFVVIDPVNCFPGNYNSLNPLQPDYYAPTEWWVLGQRVHASRLLRVVGNEVPILLKPAYNFLGIPQAQILWDYVLHFQECRAAENRLLKKFSMTVFKTNMFDSLGKLGPQEASNLDCRIKYMIQNMSNDGVLVVDKEAEDVVKLETPLSGVTDIVRQALEFLAAVNRTPAVKLLGISPSGFNATGESDIRNYYDHIATRQQKMMLAPLKTVLDCLQLHLTGRIDPTISFTFNKLGEEDKKLQAEIQKVKADTAAVYMDRGTLSVEEVRQSLADDPHSGYGHIDVDELPSMPDALVRQEGAPLDDMDKAGAVYG